MKLNGKVYGIVVGSVLAFSVSSGNVVKVLNTIKEIDNKLIYKDDEGNLYKLVNIKGPLKGTITKDIDIDFIFKKIKDNSRYDLSNDIAILEEIIYSSKIPVKLYPSDTHDYFITGEILESLSSRLLFGTRNVDLEEKIWRKKQCWFFL